MTRKSIKTKLAERLLADLGLEVDVADFHVNRGASRRNDEISWDAWCNKVDSTASVRIFSWETMTHLVRCDKITAVREDRRNPYSLEICGSA